MTRSAVVHAGWPKTATTTLQHQLRIAWPNLAGRPWSRPGGEACKSLLRELVRTPVDGRRIDELLQSSWHDRSLPVVLSHEGLIGMRKWQHGRSSFDSTAIPRHLAATSWPVRVVFTLRDPVALVRSHYRYAVRSGYARPYAEFLEEERAALLIGRGPFSIRNVVEAWEACFGRESILIAWMEAIVVDPAAFWNDVAALNDVAEFARVADAPFEHRNPTNLGPLRWELAINSALAPHGGLRRSPHTARLRRIYSRLAGRVFTAVPQTLEGGALERSVVEPMYADVAWLNDRYHPRSVTS